MIELDEIIRQYPKEQQKVEFYDQMLKEYIHHYMLQALYTSKFANNIHFLGGTALRLFYGLKRFSEDIDFDCYDLTREQFIEVTDMVANELRHYGFDVMCDDKKKYEDLNAYRRVLVFPELKFKMGLSHQKEARFFIKIEAQSHKLNYKADIKILNGFGITVPVSLVPIDIIFATKIAAALTRKKDRDFFDIIHLLTFAEPNYEYLNSKFNINTPEKLKSSLLKAANSKKLASRKQYDCEHMLFFKNDIRVLKRFNMNILSNNKLN